MISQKFTEYKNSDEITEILYNKFPEMEERLNVIQREIDAESYEKTLEDKGKIVNGDNSKTKL